MRDLKYPIYFFNSATCVYCGEENTVDSIDKFDRVAKKTDIFPIYKMRCSHCKREFFIRWIDIDDETHTARPVAISKNVIDEFISEVEEKTAEQASNTPSYDRYEVTEFGTF